MRGGLVGMALTLCTPGAFGVKARGDFREYTQPDGTVLRLRLAGDENFHYYEDESGRRMTFDGETFRLLSATRGELPKRSYGKLPGTRFPSTGSPKALVILVEFANQDFITPQADQYFHEMLAGEQFSRDGAYGSALNYFSDNSLGLFTPRFDVYGPVRLGQSVAYYGGNDEYGYDRRPHEMVIEACQKLDDEVDFRDYDVDEDGVIDNVFVFYAGRGEASGGGPNSIWPHSLSIRSLELGQKFKFDGVELNNYACTNEWVDNHTTGIGTFCHEFCHVLGLPDLYSITYATGVFSPGDWSLMDHGSYNDDERTPAGLSIFERYALGWIEPMEIGVGMNVTLPHIASGTGALLPSHDEGEFFLLENRQQQGWDRFIPGHGMLIWHIDYLERIWKENKVNDYAEHQYVDIEEADNIQDAETRDGDSFPGTAGITRINDDTSPSLRPWSGRKLKVEISGIEETPEGEIRFAVHRPGDSGVSEVSGEGIRASVHDGVLVVENPEGQPWRLLTLTGEEVCGDRSPRLSFTLPSRGIYLLQTQTGTLKLAY